MKETGMGTNVATTFIFTINYLIYFYIWKHLGFLSENLILFILQNHKRFWISVIKEIFFFLKD